MKKKMKKNEINQTTLLEKHNVHVIFLEHEDLKALEKRGKRFFKTGLAGLWFPKLKLKPLITGETRRTYIAVKLHINI
jgi:hypothetical protein